MKHCCVGHPGFKLPEGSPGFGIISGAHYDLARSRELLRTAFDHGITDFDVANNFVLPPVAAKQKFGQYPISYF